MAPGPRTILSSLVAKVLGRVFALEPETIHAQLIRSNASLTLENVNVRPGFAIQVAPASSFVLSGKILEIEISWAWSQNSLMMEAIGVTVRGARLELRHAEVAEVSPSKTSDTSQSFTDLVMGLESVKQAINKAIDCLSIRFMDFQVNFIVKTTEVVLAWEVLEMLSRDANSPKPSTLPRSDGPQIRVSSIYCNLMDTGRVFSILEPLSYSVDASRNIGSDMWDILGGYRFVGSNGRNSLDTENYAKCTLHVCPNRLAAILRLQEAMHGKVKSGQDGDRISTLKDTLEESFPASSAAHLSALAQHTTLRQWISVLFFVCLHLGILLRIFKDVSSIFVWLLASVDIFVLSSWAFPRFIPRRRKTESLKLKSGVYCFPMVQVELKLPQMYRIRFDRVTVAGTLRGEFFEGQCRRLAIENNDSLQLSDSKPSIVVVGIRLRFDEAACLLNVDAVDMCYLPGIANLVRPLRCSVIRYQEDTCQVKIQSITFNLLDSKQSGWTSEVLHIYSLFVKETIRDKNTSLDDVRLGLATRIAREVAELLPQAVDFENLIPLGSHWYNLQRFKRCFFGHEAVSLMVSCGMAESRRKAVQLGRSFQASFNLFVHVTNDVKFCDSKRALFSFVPRAKRRNWDIDPGLIANSALNERHQLAMPFSILLTIDEVNVEGGNTSSRPVHSDSIEVLLLPDATTGGIDATMRVQGSVGNDMLELHRIRCKALYHPELPAELHRLQLSVEYVRVSPGYSADDWFKMFGMRMDLRKQKSDGAPLPQHKVTTSSTGNQGKKLLRKLTSKLRSSDRKRQNPAPEALDFQLVMPYCYVEGFKLRLSYQGFLIDAKQTIMFVPPFVGKVDTSITELVVHFVTIVLAEAPGILSNVRILGVNVFESTALATGIQVGARFVPFGHFIGAAAIALLDGARVVLRNGRMSRGQPDGRYKPGDICRGIVYTMGEVAWKGADLRGNLDNDDESLQGQKVGPIDFVVGVSVETARYTYNNKARLSGAILGGVAFIGTSLVLTPVGGIFCGVAVSAGTQYFVEFLERKFEGDFDSDEEDSSSEFLVA